MITATDFRDKSIAELLVVFDWEGSGHSAHLRLRDSAGDSISFELLGLTAWGAYEDFAAQHIEQCTCLQDAVGCYLSLDPHLEGQRSEQDNFWFVCASIESGAGSNNSFKPKPLRGSA